MATSLSELNFRFARCLSHGAPEAFRLTVRSPGSCGRSRIAQFRDSQPVVCGSSKEGSHLRLRLTDEAAQQAEFSITLLTDRKMPLKFSGGRIRCEKIRTIFPKNRHKGRGGIVLVVPVDGKVVTSGKHGVCHEYTWLDDCSV